MYSTKKKKGKRRLNLPQSKCYLMRDDGYLVVWLLYMFYRYTVVLYTVTLLRSLHSTQTTRFRSYLCQSLVSMFLQLLQSRAPECVVQFFFVCFYQTELVNTGLGYKRTHIICFVVVQSVEKPGGTVGGNRRYGRYVK